MGMPPLQHNRHAAGPIVWLLPGGHAAETAEIGVPGMHDMVIRGGTILDGTGAPAFTGDVAIDGEAIVAVGGKAGPAQRVIEAAGLSVTPGCDDVPTPYDG